MGHGDREIAKSVSNPVGCVAVSVVGALAEESNRLFAIEDADRHRQPPQTVPVKVARCGDEGSNSVALGGKISQVVEILHVVEDEESVRCVR